MSLIAKFLFFIFISDGDVCDLTVNVYEVTGKLQHNKTINVSVLGHSPINISRITLKIFE